MARVMGRGMERNLRKPGFLNRGIRLSFLGKWKIEYRQKIIVVKILLLLLILGILGGTFSLMFFGQKKYVPSPEDFKSSKLAYAKGISFVEYHGEKKVYAVSINTFSVERARLGPFAIGPMHVAHLKKLNVDLYLDGIESKSNREKLGDRGLEGEILDFESPISSIKRNLPVQMRKIKGLKIEDVSFNLWRNEKRMFRISSDTATIDRETGDIIFIGHATMDAGEKGNLVSHRIRWDRKSRLFKVMDLYYFTKDGKRTEGRGIETDHLFQRMNELISKQ